MSQLNVANKDREINRLTEVAAAWQNLAVDRGIDLAAKDAQIAALRKALKNARDTVRLHAHAISAEVDLIHDAALEMSGGVL